MINLKIPPICPKCGKPLCKGQIICHTLEGSFHIWCYEGREPQPHEYMAGSTPFDGEELLKIEYEVLKRAVKKMPGDTMQEKLKNLLKEHPNVRPQVLLKFCATYGIPYKIKGMNVLEKLKPQPVLEKPKEEKPKEKKEKKRKMTKERRLKLLQANIASLAKEYEETGDKKRAEVLKKISELLAEL